MSTSNEPTDRVLGLAQQELERLGERARDERDRIAQATDELRNVEDQIEAARGELADLADVVRSGRDVLVSISVAVSAAERWLVTASDAMPRVNDRLRERDSDDKDDDRSGPALGRLLNTDASATDSAS